MPTLKVTSGPAAGRTFDIAGEMLIGREKADLTLADPEVSRRHAMLRPVGDAVAVEDLGSTNGTLVNGKKIDGVVVVSETGTLRIGTSELVIDIPIPEIVPEPLPEPAPEAPAAAPEAAATSLRNVPPPVDDRTAARPVPMDPAAPPPPAEPAPPPEPAAPPQPEPAAAEAAPPVDDRTAARPIAQPQAPRPAAPDPAMPAAAPPATPAVPATGPPPIAAAAPAVQPSAAGAKAPPRRSPLPFVAAGLVVLIAVGIAIAAAASGSSKKTRTINANLTTVPLTTVGRHAVQAGLIAGAPGSSESGSVTLDEHFKANENSPKPVGLTANVTMRYSGGTLRITTNATASPKKNGGVTVTGIGRVVGGSGTFKGATGTVTLNGGRASGTATHAAFVVRGRVKS